MDDKLFRVLMDLMMVSDPWLLDDQAHELLKAELNRQSVSRGYEEWITAYHEFKPGD